MTTATTTTTATIALAIGEVPALALKAGGHFRPVRVATSASWFGAGQRDSVPDPGLKLRFFDRSGVNLPVDALGLTARALFPRHFRMFAAGGSATLWCVTADFDSWVDSLFPPDRADPGDFPAGVMQLHRATFASRGQSAPPSSMKFAPLWR